MQLAGNTWQKLQTHNITETSPTSDSHKTIVTLVTSQKWRPSNNDEQGLEWCSAAAQWLKSPLLDRSMTIK